MTREERDAFREAARNPAARSGGGGGCSIDSMTATLPLRHVMALMRAADERDRLREQARLPVKVRLCQKGCDTGPDGHCPLCGVAG